MRDTRTQGYIRGIDRLGRSDQAEIIESRVHKLVRAGFDIVGPRYRAEIGHAVGESREALTICLIIDYQAVERGTAGIEQDFIFRDRTVDHIRCIGDDTAAGVERAFVAIDQRVVNARIARRGTIVRGAVIRQDTPINEALVDRTATRRDIVGEDTVSNRNPCWPVTVNRAALIGLDILLVVIFAGSTVAEGEAFNATATFAVNATHRVGAHAVRLSRVKPSDNVGCCGPVARFEGDSLSYSDAVGGTAIEDLAFIVDAGQNDDRIARAGGIDRCLDRSFRGSLG